jgi:hypothetical protein
VCEELNLFDISAHVTAHGSEERLVPLRLRKLQPIGVAIESRDLLVHGRDVAKFQ